MLKATIHIQRKNSQGVQDDDILRFYEEDDYQQMIRIKYSSPELTKDNVFYLPISHAVTYLSDILKSFRHDADPFEFVQVTTSIHPAVLYHVWDMDVTHIRERIEDMVESALRRPVLRCKKED